MDIGPDCWPQFYCNFQPILFTLLKDAILNAISRLTGHNSGPSGEQDTQRQFTGAKEVFGGPSRI